MHRKPPRLRHPRALGLVGGGALDAIGRELLLQEDVEGRARHLRRRLVVEDGHHVRVEVAARLWRAQRRRVDAVAARRLLERALAAAERDAENRRFGVGEGRRALEVALRNELEVACLLYTSPSPRDQRGSRMPSSA